MQSPVDHEMRRSLLAVDTGYQFPNPLITPRGSDLTVCEQRRATVDNDLFFSRFGLGFFSVMRQIWIKRCSTSNVFNPATHFNE